MAQQNTNPVAAWPASSAPPPLPRRRASAVRRNPPPLPGRPNTSSSGGSNSLPPHLFPCCPFCKSRNRPGEGQMIFWEARKEGYLCSHGHSFQRNGMPYEYDMEGE